MNIVSRAQLVALSPQGERIAASAARISTTKGTAQGIFELPHDREKDRRLVEKVLSSGHKSVIEHIVATIAFSNVSAWVEEYLIECRLASFTVKSRRYVDFGDMGWRQPPSLTGEALAIYRRYMDTAFDGYRRLLEADVPKEDARFLLPYAFCSNFYCTVNLRELLHILRDIRYGRGRRHEELQTLGQQLRQQLLEHWPELSGELDAPFSLRWPEDDAKALRTPQAPVLVSAKQAGQVRLLQTPSQPEEHLRAAWAIARPGRGTLEDVSDLLHDARPRELEQIAYTFVIEDITLSGITHLVRHRMQSPLIPPVEDVAAGRYILPQRIAATPETEAAYRQCIETLFALGRQALALPEMVPLRGYFALSGTLAGAAVTLNARQAVHFLRLRTCSRAQWEIRQIAVRMLADLRQVLPALFEKVGPGCYMDGHCPEGRLTCGEMPQVRGRFAGALDRQDA